MKQEYWLERKVDWGIVTELDLSKVFCRNLHFFHMHFKIGELQKVTADDLLDHIRMTRAKTLADALNEFELSYGLNRGEAFSSLKHLIASKQVRIDLTTAFTKRMEMSQLEIETDEEESLRWVR